MRKTLFSFIADRVLPVFCCGCGSEGVWLCDVCAQNAALLPPVWDTANPPLLGSAAICPYQDTAAGSAVRTLKYERARGAAQAMRLLFERWLSHGGASFFTPNTMLVPVPLYWYRWSQRGFNQATQIARAFGKSAGLPVALLLRRIRNTPPQAQKNRAQRFINIESAFGLARRPRIIYPARRRLSRTETLGRTIVLIDDVSTTGATMQACARVLRHHGLTNIYGFTFAREL